MHFCNLLYFHLNVFFYSQNFYTQKRISLWNTENYLSQETNSSSTYNDFIAKYNKKSHLFTFSIYISSFVCVYLRNIQLILRCLVEPLLNLYRKLQFTKWELGLQLEILRYMYTNIFLKHLSFYIFIYVCICWE